ncbi:general stress protein [Paenibacillus sp. GSMTC-2017]|uniref:general stress protein n=1 Tax=Paenibacillus sp. GSMTC-2017 TaxID=2794350 RepID=UPI0018D9B812|nr:general stress protein [Paenibacillus sp. GSMTC-2017]MBH5320009.1 general stress protein [Paenibacillus sp. GSMTC-2017]
MTKKIGLFDSEQQVIDVINQLEQEGFAPGEIKVLTKDLEHARRIKVETDIHADGMHELTETNERSSESSTSGNPMTSSFGDSNAPGGYGIASYGSYPAVGGIYSFGSPFPFLESKQLSSYRALGLDDNEAELCFNGVESGGFAIVVETDESKSLMDKDDGADLSKLSVAEGIFRQRGATRITNGK